MKLTEKDRLDRGMRLAEAEERLSQLLEEKKASTADFSAREKAVEAEMSKIALAIRQGHEPKTVQCEEIADFTQKKVRHVRLDTREILEDETRDLRDHEKQADLLGSELNPSPPKGGSRKRPSMEDLEAGDESAPKTEVEEEWP